MSMSVLLRCDDLKATREFYHSALGFDTQNSADRTLTVHRYGGKMVFTQQDLWRGWAACTGTFYFTVPRVP